MEVQTLQRAANVARKLAMDAIAGAKSGHLGLPLGAAEIGAALFGEILVYDPKNPRWINRDRLVLSAGHGSMWLYGWLHLAGYDVSLEDIKQFRQLNSKTPGHPEFGHTAGVECTTGPLGQGVANAVGMAAAGKKMASEFPEGALDYAVVCVCGDGCLQEGISYEAASLAGLWQLDNLILIYDSNDVTLDAPLGDTHNEDTVKRFEACHFDVQTVDGHDIAALIAAYKKARSARNGRPQLIVAKTRIAKSIPEVENSPKGHGESGAAHIENAQRNLGLSTEKFAVEPEIYAAFKVHAQQLHERYLQWEQRYAAHLPAAPTYFDATTLLEKLTPNGKRDCASRVASEQILQLVAQQYPNFLSGSADLFGSTKNYLAGCGDFSAQNVAGRNLRFGVREHAMGGILNGFAYEGHHRVLGATFLVFSDYLKPTVRVAALAKLPVIYAFTHDSVYVGEDGPTHQPIEQLQGLRAIPNLYVVRPADIDETVGTYALALGRNNGPTALILSRQDLPALNVESSLKRQGVLRGGYILQRETNTLQAIVIASGSEVSPALAAAEKFNGHVRVISMPCVELFLQQTSEYIESVLPKACTQRCAVEAGTSHGWYRVANAVVGIDCFGTSAPGHIAMQTCGIHVDAIVAALKTC